MPTRWWIALEVATLLALAGVVAALVVVTEDEQVRVETVTATETRVVTTTISTWSGLTRPTTKRRSQRPPTRVTAPNARHRRTAVETAAEMYLLRASDPLAAARRYDHPVARRYGCPPIAAARAYARLRWTPFKVVASRRVDWTLASLGVRFRDARELTVRRPGGTTTFHMARYRGAWRAFPRCR